jgi:hypothetical protein
MSRKFQLQERHELPTIWVTPTSFGLPGFADTAPELRQAILDMANSYSYSSPRQYRIVTDAGTPVERWKVTAGKAKKLRRRY